MRVFSSLFKVDLRACPIKSYRCTALSGPSRHAARMEVGNNNNSWQQSHLAPFLHSIDEFFKTTNSRRPRSTTFSSPVCVIVFVNRSASVKGVLSSVSVSSCSSFLFRVQFAYLEFNLQDIAVTSS